MRKELIAPPPPPPPDLVRGGPMPCEMALGVRLVGATGGGEVALPFVGAWTSSSSSSSSPNIVFKVGLAAPDSARRMALGAEGIAAEEDEACVWRDGAYALVPTSRHVASQRPTRSS